MHVVRLQGGLGSQMMGFALFLAMRHKGINAYCDVGWYENNLVFNGEELTKIFQIKIGLVNTLLSRTINSQSLGYKIARGILVRVGMLKIYTAEVSSYNYDSDVFNQSRPIVIYDQCWTAWKYFEGVEQLIKETYIFPKLDLRNDNLLNQIIATESVAIHIRRGDAIIREVLQDVIDRDYYLEAIHYFLSRVHRPTFFIFSDDIVWAKENLTVENSKYIDWNVGEESYKDMQLMAMCKHQIIANSSFSWWSAYLNRNPNGCVVTPKRWVNYGYGIELRDMNMPDWHQIDN